MKPLVSVLMPALNEEGSIAGAIASVLAQTDVQVEVLVIHGPSVDATGRIVEELAAADERVRLIPNPRTLIPVALNLGLQAARGEYIARVDAHSNADPSYLSRGVAWMARNPKLASVGGLRKGVASTPTGRAIALALSSKAAIGNSINHYATEPQLTDHASMAVTRTAAARQVGGWDESLPVNEDVDFDHRLIQAGYQIGFDPAMKVDWHVRETVPQLFRQYRRYGRGKAAMLRKNGAEAIRLRHLVPPAFVVGTGVLLLGGLFRRGLWALLVPYLGLLAAASAQAWRNRDPKVDADPAALPPAFAAVHTGWGLGMLEGLLLGKEPHLASGNSAVNEPTTK